jgi:hypothetical protein
MHAALRPCLLLAIVSGLLGCGQKTGPQPSSQPSAGTVAASPASGGPTKAPSELAYPNDNPVYTKGVDAPVNAPFFTGGPVASFSSVPQLPAGLNLDPASGAITGRPMAAVAAASYRIIAANSLGSTETTITITVNEPAPGVAPPVTLPATVTTGRAGLSANVPNLGKGFSYAWTLEGGTVTGGQGTPAITFTAGAPGTLTASVAIANSGGTVSASASSTVVPAPDATLTYPVWVRVGASAPASVADQPGMTYQWTVVPGDASAAITSGQGTSKVTLTAGTATGAFQLQLRITNPAGDYATVSQDIKVQQ